MNIKDNNFIVDKITKIEIYFKNGKVYTGNQIKKIIVDFDYVDFCWLTIHDLFHSKLIQRMFHSGEEIEKIKIYMKIVNEEDLIDCNRDDFIISYNCNYCKIRKFYDDYSTEGEMVFDILGEFKLDE